MMFGGVPITRMKLNALATAVSTPALAMSTPAAAANARLNGATTATAAPSLMKFVASSVRNRMLARIMTSPRTGTIPKNPTAIHSAAPVDCIVRPNARAAP